MDVMYVCMYLINETLQAEEFKLWMNVYEFTSFLNVDWPGTEKTARGKRACKTVPSPSSSPGFLKQSK